MLQIGHRGGAGDIPENTRSAFEKSIELGLKMIEFDVHRTKDGQLVLNHDYSTGRQAITDLVVSRSTLAELRELDFAAYKEDHTKVERIMTLDEVFEMLPDDMILNVEIKNVTFLKTDMAQLVVDCIVRNNRQDTVLVSAFDHEILKQIGEINPDIKIGVLLYSNLVNLPNYIKSLGIKPYSVHPAVELVDEKVIADLKADGYKVYVYTVNNKEDFDIIEKAGATGVFTDIPGVIEPLV